MSTFKILDLGAHDGFVTTWLARQALAEGIDVHVDGIELNPDAVEIANRRLHDDGTPGQYKVGMAEDANRMFAVADYDAVVAYELIEHVPDMGYFLGGVEAMVKPGGRVYISTPDGTFGSGNNPHHLRALRAVDVFELLRRRGEVQGMISGVDGVAVASYKPYPNYVQRREAAVYCGPGWQPWSPHDIESKGLGGSETAAVRLAESLDRIGYTVTVYGECEQMAFGQVSFRHHETFDPLESRHLVVVSRLPHAFDRPIQADCKVLWMHDTDYGDMLTEERVAKMDGVMVLSQWHKRHVAEMYPFTEDKLVVTRNGIEPEYFTKGFKGIDFERNPHRAIFSSSPDRGLDFLLRIWPMVRNEVDDAELFYCYSDVYSAIARQRPDLRKFHEQIQLLSGQPGVVNLGSLPQPGLAAAMRECGVWLAPSYNSNIGAQFMETYCIGAVEAAAAGCRRVMSSWGALPERSLNPGPAALMVMSDEAPDEQEWAEAIIEQMTNPGDYTSSKEALALSWDGVADDFDNAWIRSVQS